MLLLTQDDGHRPRDTFMFLPSKEEYPDYYEVIQEPIDLTMIKERMDTNKVGSSFHFLCKIAFLNLFPVSYPSSNGCRFTSHVQ